MRLTVVAASLLLAAGSGGGLTFLLSSADVGGTPMRIDAADLDGDSDIDLFVVADAGTTSIQQVLLNQGGSFAPGWSASQPVGSLGFSWDLDLADTDSDGDTDLLFVTPSAPKERFNDGDGNFPTSGFLDSFSLRDDQEPVDADDNGDVDLVYFEADIIGYFGTMKGKSNGQFDWDLSTETQVSGFPDHARRFVIGDVAGDGFPDAAMASANGLEFLRGKAPVGTSTLPGFLPPLKVYPKACVETVLVDLNGDGRLDIVASVPSLDSVVVLLTRTSGLPGLPRLFSAGEAPEAIAAADLDLDGKADIIVANPTTKSVSVMRGAGTGGLLAPVAQAVGRRPNGIVAADLDDDGDVDLAVSCALDGNVALLFNETL